MSGRRAHTLNRNDGCELYNRIVLMDSESHVDNIDTPDAGPMMHHPFLLVSRFVIYDHGGRHHTDRVDWDRLPQENGNGFAAFWDALDAFTPSKKRTVVYAHNMGYDFAVLDGSKEMAKRGYRGSPPFDSGAVFTMTFRNPDTKKTILFLSSTNYYAASLRQLGKVFGIEKLDIDYSKMSRVDAQPYAIRDLDILDAAISTFRSFVRDNDLGTMSQTLAAQAMTAYRHRFMPHPITLHCDDNALQLERDAYFGGRVECLRVGKHTGTFHKLDVNSMYPARMATDNYPVKLRWQRRYPSLDDMQTWIDAGYSVVARCHIVTDVPMYPLVRDGVLLYPVGEFDTALCTPEIVQAIARGHLQSVSQVCVYESAPIFVEYVDWFYPRKRDETDPVLSYMYKIFLNALYGKFGQRAHDHEVLGECDPDLFRTERVKDTDTGEWRTVKFYGGIMSQEIAGATPTEREGYNSFPAIAAHVTSAARMLLWGFIEIAGIDHCYYTDTDSLFVDDVGLERLQPYIDKSKLGMLKNEGTATVIELRNPKDYTFSGTVKRKGVSKDAALMPDGTYRTVQWPSFTGMMRRGGQYANIVRNKRIDPVYKKAWVYPGGVTVPLAFDGDRILPRPDALNYVAICARYAILNR